MSSADVYNGSYTWNLKEFAECEAKQRFTADTFNIGSLPFTLEAYPNGDKSGANLGSFMLYCTLLSIPDNYQQIVLNVRLYCTETNSSFTSIAIFTSQRNSAGWSADTIKLNELKQLNNITIGCKINILKIIGNNNDIIYESESSMKSIYSFKWTIDSELINSFQNCRVGKAFESEIFEDLFCLRCLPNGKRANDIGNVKLYLLLCGAIPNDSTGSPGIHILYTLWCNETDSGYNSKIVLNYEYSTVGWPNKIQYLKQINDINDLKSLTFNAEIEIINETKDNQIDNDSDHENDSSTYSSSSSLDYGIKGVISQDAYDMDEKNNMEENKTENIIINDELSISPPQITAAQLMPPQANDNDNENDSANEVDIQNEIPKSESPPPPTPDIDIKQDIEESKFKQDIEEKKENKIIKKKHIHKHHKNKKRLTVAEFKSASLEDLIENDIDILDNWDIAKKICKYFDKQFDDTDTVCMVAEKDKQPTISYWVKGEYVRKHTNICGKHILVYRASRHSAAKKPIVSKKEFEDYVRKLSIQYQTGSCNTIADKLDAKFGTGCHYARSATKSSQYDVFCRFSDKYECGFKLKSGAFIIAWRR